MSSSPQQWQELSIVLVLPREMEIHKYKGMEIDEKGK